MRGADGGVQGSLSGRCGTSPSPKRHCPQPRPGALSGFWGVELEKGGGVFVLPRSPRDYKGKVRGVQRGRCQGRDTPRSGHVPDATPRPVAVCARLGTMARTKPTRSPARPHAKERFLENLQIWGQNILFCG